MPLSPAYNPATSFANDETNQVAGRSTVRTVALDTEHANISASINSLKTNLEKVQRDDGKLKDFLVEPYALAEQTRALITSRGTPRGLWAAGIAYAVGDVVQQSTFAYQCYTAHTSTAPFTADGFWIGISGDGSAATAAAAAQASQVAAAASAALADADRIAAEAAAALADADRIAAGISATAAGNSASAASGSAAAAAASESNAAMIYDNFDDRYLGPKAAAPTLDNDGNALITGALYFNTTDSPPRMYVRNGTPAWQAVATVTSPFIATLLDDADAATARATLGANDAANLTAGKLPAARLDGRVLVAVTRFTASGTWTKAAATTAIYIEAMGGGGGGANANAQTGGGGGSGGVLASAYNTSPPASAAVTIGAGGATGTDGAVGGTTSLAALLTAAGGAGGRLAAGGVSVSGCVSSPAGVNGGGNGGGQGGRGSLGTAGAANTGGGGGGGGTASGAGGAGGSGYLIVWEFA